MKASVVDLRYRTSEVLGALSRRERVQLLHHGKVKGVILPAGEVSARPVSEHPFFGTDKEKQSSVAEVMQALQGGRYV